MDPETRAESAFREQDLLAAADALADAVAEHIRLGLVQLPLSIDNALARYRRERRGERQPPVEDAPASPDSCPLTTRFPNSNGRETTNER